MIAAILLLAASYVRPGRDLELALELRDNAIEQFAAVAANPVDLASRALLGPLTGIVLRTLRSAVGRAPKEAEGEIRRARAHRPFRRARRGGGSVLAPGLSRGAIVLFGRRQSDRAARKS